jgi:hypothetical protein
MVDEDFGSGSGHAGAYIDTVWFGGHDGSGYAIEGGIWDFDNGGAGPDWQGWYGVDQTQNTGVPWGTWVTAADFDCPDDAPMIHDPDVGGPTAGQLWFGKHGATADQECWVCDAGGDCADPGSRVGYSNKLCQRADSPSLTYSGGDLAIEFDYFLDLEGFPYDFIRVQIVAQPSDEIILVRNLDEGSGGIIGDPDNPAAFGDSLTSDLVPPGTASFTLRFEFTSDAGWSDADNGGGICSTYGPFGCDNISVSETGLGELAGYDFDSDDEGWTFSHCPGVGNLVDIHPVSMYQILDPCHCGLSGWVLGFHDENLEHPGDSDGSGTGQANAAVSPIIDRTAYPAEESWSDIFHQADMYGWMPLDNGVLYRPGAQFYPWECAESGATGWSPRTGQAVWFYVGTDPVCFTSYNNYTDDGIPGNADLYRIWIEILSCCHCFGIGDDCTGITNETPLLDNIRFGLTKLPNAPVVSFDHYIFIDGWAQDGTLSPTSTGRSDNPAVDAGTVAPYVLGDSISVAGPVVGSDTPPWESHLWFRLARKGPGQDAVPAYTSWRSRLSSATFPGDPEMEFVGVRMDSCQLGGNAFSNKYCSFAHPDDGFFTGDPEGDELTDLNEIVPDNVFTPGTRIEYFATANYIGESELFLLPDTSRTVYEFEILPSMRWSGAPEESDIVWPSFLYWDGINRGQQSIIDPALDAVLPVVPGEGPSHDRYDELGASSCFGGGSIYRLGVGANNGGTLVQLIGYRTILLNTGVFPCGGMMYEDIHFIQDWLSTTICGISSQRRGFIANGDQIADLIDCMYPAMVSQFFGAGLECGPYREPDCPLGAGADSSYCVAVIDADGAVYASSAPYYVFGNGCPNVYHYSVLFPTSGVGNRNWFDYDGDKGVVSFAQVVMDQSGGDANYRAVIDGYSYDHVTTSLDGEENECVPDLDGRVTAAGNEIMAALNWIYDGSPPIVGADSCGGTAAAPDAGVETQVNRLYQNEPNPFNPRTLIRFSLARRGPVELTIYDVRGRAVRRLIDRPMDAGLHSVVWDGADNNGHRASSGIYWSQMRAGDYVSNRKLVLLK